MRRLKTETTWAQVDAPTFSPAWEADVQGERWRVTLRAPHAVSLYTLHVDGLLVERFNVWPGSWEGSEDTHLRGAYESDWIHDERQSPEGRMNLALVALRERASGGDARVLDAITAEVEQANAVAAFQAAPVEPRPSRAVAFSGDPPSRPEGPMYPELAAAVAVARAAPQPRQGQLLDLLDGLNAKVRARIYAAECADFAGSQKNAAQHLWAAGHVDRAAALAFAWLGVTAVAG